MERNQQVILTKSGEFREGDIQKVLDILTDSANKTLKVRPRKTGLSPVTGTGQVQKNMLLMKVEIPMDSRYKQTPDAIKAFNNDWSNAVHQKLGVNSGGFVPAELR